MVQAGPEGRILIQDGTGVAAELARAVARLDPIVIAATDGRRGVGAARPRPWTDARGCADWLAARHVARVLDAAHAFDEAASLPLAQGAALAGIPYARFLRPAWRPEPGDVWVRVDGEAGAAAHVPAGSTVFVATGRERLEEFAALSSCRLLVRVLDPDPGPFPFANGDWLPGRPPFSVDEEEALFRAHRVDWMVVRNAGGKASHSKLEAARRLGIRVAMIRPPPQPRGTVFTSVRQALDWLLPDRR